MLETILASFSLLFGGCFKHSLFFLAIGVSYSLTGVVCAVEDSLLLDYFVDGQLNHFLLLVIERYFFRVTCAIY